MELPTMRKQALQEYDEQASAVQAHMKDQDLSIAFYRYVFFLHVLYVLGVLLFVLIPQRDLGLQREGEQFAKYGGSIAIASATFIFLECFTLLETGYREPLARIPGLLYACLFGLAAMTAVALIRIDAGWSLTIQVALAMLLLLAWTMRSARNKTLKILTLQVDELAAALREQERIMTDPVELAKPRCTICKQESQYDVCLSCEKSFQDERHRVRSQILRAKQAGTPATLTLAEWLDTLHTFHSHCAYCYGPFQVIEHYIPISQGGGTTRENCVPACIKCNAKKTGKHPEK